LEKILRTIGMAAILLLAITACDSALVRTPDSFSPPYVAPRESGGDNMEELSTPATLQCLNDARFIEDLTIQDGEVVQPGADLEKRWLVANAGTCDWGPGYVLVRTDPGDFPAPERQALYPARAGMEGPWTINMRAPNEEGEYIASWQAQSPDGIFFGDIVFVLFNVEEDKN
jgi:hypothetical protein